MHPRDSEGVQKRRRDLKRFRGVCPMTAAFFDGSFEVVSFESLE